ncbi:ABC-2 type transport system ATP-binding protein [Okibacterium sp. HSC-33S16]|uniref:ABC transporter ATP-binding protein n=1 Tax=Okibacterium sp. HSC-33S16 TaxID=2910965 RepID=UPI00209D85D7|nr:ABC transporter ATP-binding protein [Okibacterium sp. HSC-33S16]MCP2032899.1 ABC-2 type transport system ATP-binding protein [Okibacterium sp. HSC-33S16]
MSTVIQARNLQKHFGRVHALDGLDLDVQPGEIHGFLGPNGAGKSTTIRILLGLARPTGGEATVFGQNSRTDAVSIHCRLAYVPGDVSLWPNLTGGEAIDLLSRLRGIRSRDEYDRRKRHLLDVFELDPSKKGRTYSKGNRQKVALVAAFAVPAELYLLDEPTSGLDPLMEAVFRRELSERVADGGTVLLSSHILSEVEQLCSRVSIIRAGRRVEEGSLAELRRLTRTEVSFSAANLTEADLAGIPAARDVRIDSGRVAFTVDSATLLEALPVLAALRVEGLTITPPSLEELFLRHYGLDRNDAQPPTAAVAAEPAHARHARSGR